jgi:formylglycine-generating enzyme required for sulfatase activity
MLERFYCARYTITNRQFLTFMQQAVLDYWSYSREAFQWCLRHPLTYDPDAPDDEPRTGVCWYDAVAFSRWLSSHLQLRSPLQIRLPTEHEWQLAAQGPEKFNYPWGNTFDASRCNTSESAIGHVRPVTAYESGESDYFVRNASGNVREWCINPLGQNRGRLDTVGARAMRGGSFRLGADAATTTARAFTEPETAADDLGFRIVFAAFYIR